MPHELAKGYHYMDAFSGKTLRLDSYEKDQHIGRKLYLYCITIHAGMVWGLPYQILLLLACLGVAVQAYSGFSPYLRRAFRKPAGNGLRLKLAKKSVEAVSICSFELVHPEGKRLPPFSAGSHIDVHLPDGIVRQYSLCNDPDDAHRYVIGVLLHPESRGGSRAMHDVLKVGDLVQVSLPRNHFALDHAAKRSLLIAGGIGITPILCMAERLSNAGADFSLHYCSRNRMRTAFMQRIRSSAFAQRVHFYFSDEPESARIDLDTLLSNPDQETHLYVCGPSGFMDAVLGKAAEHGWPAALLHREYFSGAVQSSDQDVAFDVKLASSGKVIRVERTQTVLAALARCGVTVQSSCAEGVCGTCLTRVIEGNPDHRDLFLTAQERARMDSFLPCCSRATSGMLVLDL
jgi:ferredoxin-NADP reductase